MLYVFLDGLYEPLRTHGIQKKAILCARAITTEGRKVLLSTALGSRESYDGWLEFLRDLVHRGLPVPLTITSDGAPGLLRAIDEVWPRSLRLRCWVHRMRNFKAKVPDHMWPEVKAHLEAIRDAPNAPCFSCRQPRSMRYKEWRLVINQLLVYKRLRGV